MIRNRFPHQDPTRKRRRSAGTWLLGLGHSFDPRHVAEKFDLTFLKDYESAPSMYNPGSAVVHLSQLCMRPMHKNSCETYIRQKQIGNLRL